jgi:predicted Zn-dependent protease
MLIKRFDEAREAFDRALELVPGAPTIWSARGSLALTEKDFDTAVRCYQRTAELLPDVPVVRLNLAIGMSMTARPAGAAAEIERAARLLPANSPLMVDTFVSWARALNYVPGADPAAVCRVHVQAAELLAQGAKPRTSHANVKDPERKLRRREREAALAEWRGKSFDFDRRSEATQRAVTSGWLNWSTTNTNTCNPVCPCSAWRCWVSAP